MALIMCTKDDYSESRLTLENGNKNMIQRNLFRVIKLSWFTSAIHELSTNPNTLYL